MKKVPTTFELDEDDLREAITEWLNNNHNDSVDSYTITFKSETKEVPRSSAYRGPIGGMTDPVMKTVVSAVAVKDE